MRPGTIPARPCTIPAFPAPELTDPSYAPPVARAAHESRLRARLPIRIALALPPTLTACAGPQSSLITASSEAERIASLWWWMAGGGLLIWLAVVALLVYAIRLDRERHSERGARLLIIGAGAALPTVVLGGLLAHGLSMMPSLLALPTDQSLRIEVSGEQWWWRVRYHVPGREPIELANEVRLPVGRRVELTLSSPDVIHSFWIPSIAGKMDMIPGRVTRLPVEPTRTGVFRGACAEYCGASHAHMALYAAVLEESEFARWLESQASPARPPAEPLARRGERLFIENGCGACHTVRGTEASGVVGPDLTHVGGRLSIAAGVLPIDAEAVRRWITDPASIKPGVHMPAFGMLPADDVRAIAAYLVGLQ